MENEIWKDVKGYEGFYEVSNMGLVRSKERTVLQKNGVVKTLPPVILHPYTQKYQRVSLSIGGIETSYLVHRLVAEAFLGDIPDGMEVDHINENPLDNRVENIRYLSRFDNASRSTKGIFRKESNAMENNPRAKRVVGVKDGVVVETFPCAKYITRKYGINYSTLRARLRNGGIEIGEIIYKYEDKS